MNELIKELVAQSGFGVRQNEVYTSKLEHLPITENIQKFAELIVEECADICINENVSIIDMNIIRESGKFTLQDLATKSCGENLSKQIKKHFGVE